MGLPRYMRSVVDRNVVMRRIPVYYIYIYIYIYIYVTLVSKPEGKRQGNRSHRLRIFLRCGECGKFETLTAVSFIIQVFWNKTPCVFVNTEWP